MFYGDTVNAARYVNNILSPFFAELTEEERLYVVFQLDSATTYTSYVRLEAMRKVFGDHIISLVSDPHGPLIKCLVTFICGEV
jgi:hypothetical protein